ncbi:MAG: hypothetical protein WDZ59_13465 [Pirellulales bacterium]
MSRRGELSFQTRLRQVINRNVAAKARSRRRGVPSGKRARGAQRNDCLPYAPPEDWHEPTGSPRAYRILEQPPGAGYRHVLTAQDIRERLEQVPPHFLKSLEVIQLSRMTRKKQTFPCYGMQWGSALYLYPLEDSLIEYFLRPPHPNLMNEARMYGGRWEHEGPSTWKLVWTEESIRDFYLNNILIHELGHLVDDRNSGYVERERYAEWFAIRYGYLPSRSPSESAPPRRTVRRHHAL